MLIQLRDRNTLPCIKIRFVYASAHNSKQEHSCSESQYLWIDHSLIPLRHGYAKVALIMPAGKSLGSAPLEGRIMIVTNFGHGVR